MLTLRDLTENIEIQGETIIKIFNDEQEMLSETDRNDLLSHDGISRYIDLEILYIYPENNATVFELKRKED